MAEFSLHYHQVAFDSWALYGNDITIYVHARVEPEVVGRFTFCVCVVCFRANEIIVSRESLGRFTFCVCVVCFRANEIIVSRENLLTKMTCERESKIPTKKYGCRAPNTRP